MIPSLHILDENEQLIVQTFSKKYVINGPRLFIKPPLQRVVERRDALALTSNEFAHVKNELTGEVRHIDGPGLFFLDAQEFPIKKEKGLALDKDEYIKVLNQNTGERKVVCGQCIYKLLPFEVYSGKPHKAVLVDEQTSVLVRNISTGALSLIKDQQAFFPKAEEIVEEIREKILLEEHEVMVLQDNEGKFHFKSGNSSESAFFVPPHWTTVEQRWSSGLHKEEKGLQISRFDLRPKFMWYEFDVRTKDNVELVLKVTFFWQVRDVKTLVKNTDDASGDVCSHSRSKIIQKVSTVDFSDFLGRFNELIREAVLQQDDTFYVSRGLNIHSVEVREISCKDSKTQDILSEIIQETTSRINRIQKQESDNDILMKKLEGESVAEKHQMKLLEMKAKRFEDEARLQGTQQALIIKSFFDSLGSEMEIDRKIRLFEALKKLEMMKNISGENTKLFLTKDDIELNLDVHSS